MRGRPVLYNDKHLIEKAQEIFWKKGYTATSLGDLLKVTGAGSGSFYNTFKGGKKEVFRKSILQRREAFNQFKKELRESESPLDLIKDFFRSIAQADKETHLKGCIIANSVVEMAHVDNDLELEAVNILKEVEQMFSDAIRKAQELQKINNHTDPQILGRYLITFWCGLNTLRRMYPDRETLLHQIEMQLAVIS
ncbi:TetR/AcrR family transcriptional regulator [Marivirga sp. S37H4]|uniref:TetR/AcrR family transcriptional regulator n=1 Tax=Marivirga aurantiaca TaxID=2802615 RepID=A0A935CDI5_9BACT|nr:TetR/AcrR family transcriptional regulator [Marivirga aurantiaca]MBK6266953.1 TetR/AcrR family transcriptional regulator [Marivirga aurantiaca]